MPDQPEDLADAYEFLTDLLALERAGYVVAVEREGQPGYAPDPQASEALRPSDEARG